MPKVRQPAQQQDQGGDDESLLVAAMANTESEIFAEAMGDEELELDGDTSLEEMDDPVGEETDPEEGDQGELEADAGGEDEEGDDDEHEADDQRGQPRREQAEDQGRGRQERPERPSYRLPPVDPRDQRIADLEGRLARVEAPRTERQEQRQPAELPDPVLDPGGFRDAMRDQIRAENQQATRTAILESNFRATEAAYDRENRREEFELAAGQLNELSQRARTDPGAAAAVRSIVNAADPGHALMQWAEDNLDLENFRQEQAGRRIEQAARLLGVDPADLEGFAPEPRQAERPRQREAARQEQRQPRGQQDRQQPAQRAGKRLPSLNSAGGVGREGGNSRNLDPNGFDGSEDSIFTFATR